MQRDILKIIHPQRFTIEPLGGKDVNKVLRAGCSALEDAEFKYWLSAGTLLGYRRGGKHIAHDTDINVGVLALSNMAQDYMEIPSIMRRYGFEYVRFVSFSDMPMQMVFVHPDENIIFDIFFFYLSKDNRSVYNHSEHGTMRKPASLFLGDLDYMYIDDIGYPTPLDIDGYLDMRYGSDWMIPKTSKESWEKDCKNMEGLK